MKEIDADIWSFQRDGFFIVIPTNGTIKQNGEAVMGRGLALQAKLKYPLLPTLLGDRLLNYGNHVYEFSQYNIITFPVKHDWMNDADLMLITKSVDELKVLHEQRPTKIFTHIYIPRVGCGNGRLQWQRVQPILERLDEQFFSLVHKGG